MPSLWKALIPTLGALLIVLVPANLLISSRLYAITTDNLRAQAVMTGALTALIFSGLLVIVVIDRPFAGTVKVSPEALSAALHDFSLQ